MLRCVGRVCIAEEFMHLWLTRFKCFASCIHYTVSAICELDPNPVKHWNGLSFKVVESPTIPGDAQEMTAHDTYCYSLADIVVISQRVNSMILKVFSNLNHSVIL